MRSTIEPGQFERPIQGPRMTTVECNQRLPLTGEPACSVAGRSLDVAIPEIHGRLVRIHVVGVLALNVGDGKARNGTSGAQILLRKSERNVFRHELVRLRHYTDAKLDEPICRLNGDGSSVESIGKTEISGTPVRVDMLTIDVPEVEAEVFRFRDNGTSAHFLIHDVLFEFEVAPGCPFRGSSGGVPLAEVGAIVRVADRVKFNRALRQLEDGILGTTDLDEARSMALTFMAVVSAALLEMGAPREMHRFQLKAARTLDTLYSVQEIAETTHQLIEDIVAPVLSRPSTTGDALMDKALQVVDRNFGKDIQDAAIADQLGLSTSHFRFLFKQATGQPFHRYLISLRLEKARQMLLGMDMPVSEIARMVGFASAAHFSRAFQQRFSVSPSSIRQAHR